MFSGFDLTLNLFKVLSRNVTNAYFHSHTPKCTGGRGTPTFDWLTPLFSSFPHSSYLFSAQGAPSSPLSITSMAPTPSTADPPKCTHTTKV